MIRHYFKIIWNRKKQNFLLFLELFIAFLVICFVFIQGVDLWFRYNQPLGFDYENRWYVNMTPEKNIDDNWSEENIAYLEQIFSTVRQMEGVEGIAGADNVPFEYSRWTWGDSIPALRKYVPIEISVVTDELAEVMGLEVVKGRWFSAEDDASLYSPVVINQDFANLAFPGEDPIGKNVFPIDRSSLTPEEEEELKDEKEKRVVGVVTNYRKQGELSLPGSFALFRSSPVEATNDKEANLSNASNMPPQSLLIKVAPGYMNAQFEESLLKNLESLMPEWSFGIGALTKWRDKRINDTITPLLSFGLVAAFLVVMVGLGLVGVVWQNVSSRISELGLRRAVGANSNHIFGQILGELLILVALSVVVATLVVVQFPLLGLLEEITLKAYFFGWSFSVSFLLVVTLVCGFYPSKIATLVRPTKALQEE